ncbi:2-keto-4-pentenoate hydratase [Rubricella aquisinus]|uniref:2-keto-4-pentenoate hydratase n=1 Tax=Rubricella aquisinus TaxID=2028108 RepID=A0A840X335_9RHOB|nr:fumarylacetoacetate hydrolase family protein [Rubricella aquisinus]MBB5516265.1 2-keto-4-pentenoate hydratase [Rubricella aquisinus]
MDLDALARHIAADRRARAPFVDFPIPDIATGYDVQDRVTALSGPVGGYKIGWNSPALLERYHVSEPAVARVMAADIRDGAAALDPGDYATLMLEPEIAAILATDLPSRAGPWTADAILPYIARFTPAFEVLDRRQGESVHAPSIIAANVFNAGAVVGEPGQGCESDLTGHATLTIGGEERLSAENTAPQPPAEAAAFIATVMQSRGQVLAQGQILLCGTHAGLQSIAPGQEAVFAIAGLGEARLTYG